LNKVNEFPSLGNKLMQLSIMREVYCWNLSRNHSGGFWKHLQSQCFELLI
jgi:hypothetical protein